MNLKLIPDIIPHHQKDTAGVITNDEANLATVDRDTIALERGRRWAQLFAEGSVSPDTIERVAEAYVRSTHQPLVYQATYPEGRIWRFGMDAIVWPTEGSLWYQQGKNFISPATDKAILKVKEYSHERQLNHIYITPFSSGWKRLAIGLRCLEITQAFKETGVPFSICTSGSRGSAYAFRCVSGYWMGQITRVLRDFRNSLPPEVVSTCFSVKAYNLMAVRWLIEGGIQEIIHYRCQALRAQPYWLARCLLDGQDTPRFSLLQASIDTGKPWLDALSQTVDEMHRSSSGSQTPSIASRRAVAFVHTRRCAPNWLDNQTQRITDQDIEFAALLSGTRQPNHKKDWKQLHKLRGLWHDNPDETALMGCPTNLGDPWYDEIDPQLICDARYDMEQGASYKVFTWLQGLGRTEGGLAYQGTPLNYNERYKSLKFITLRQWLRLSKMYHELRERAEAVVAQHPINGGTDKESTPQSWNSPPSFIASNGLRVEWLNDTKELQAEGRIMRHCVGSNYYAEACLLGRSRIASIRTLQGKSLATLEISFTPKNPETGFQLVQVYGFKDSKPTAAAKKTAKEALAQTRETGKPAPVMDPSILLKTLRGMNDTETLNRLAVDAWLSNVLWHEARRHSKVEAIVQQTRQGLQRVAKIAEDLKKPDQSWQSLNESQGTF